MEREENDTPEGAQGLRALPSIEEIRDWFDSEYWHQKYINAPEVRAILALLKRVDELETENTAQLAQLGLLWDSMMDAIGKLELSNDESRAYLSSLSLYDADTD